MDTIKTAEQNILEAQQDTAIIKQVVPTWARALNRVYNWVFAPLDRFFDRLASSSTRKMIYDFNMSNLKSLAETQRRFKN
jgi:hypothetical protein